MKKIKMLVFDIDGVITDGKRYVCGDTEIKSLSLKDLDAIHQLQDDGLKVGCISGEDTGFSQSFVHTARLDFARLGCKSKGTAFAELAEQFGLSLEEVCYIGDGKYDIPALKAAGIGVCPADAIEEARQAANVILTCRGGEGCIAELYTLLNKRTDLKDTASEQNAAIARRMDEHMAVLSRLMEEPDRIAQIGKAVSMIADCYRAHGRVLICGNGGSAADAQHLAGELVGRFYLERRALDAEALTTDTSVLTALANDYDYDVVFARQVEAKASSGDVLIGITTSGTSKNIRQAFKRAKLCGVKTILLTGAIANGAEILEDTDCLLSVPARDTPRIQEMHILIGHIICELVEKEIADETIHP